MKVPKCLICEFSDYRCLPEAKNVKIHLYKEPDKKKRRDKNYLGKFFNLNWNQIYLEGKVQHW